jgi:hypothetical protein
MDKYKLNNEVVAAAEKVIQENSFDSINVNNKKPLAQELTAFFSQFHARTFASRSWF